MHLFDLSFKWLIPKEKISKRSLFKDQEWIRGCFLRRFQEEKGTMVLHLLNWLTTYKLYLSAGLKTLGVPNVTSFCNRFNIWARAAQTPDLYFESPKHLEHEFRFIFVAQPKKIYIIKLFSWQKQHSANVLGLYVSVCWTSFLLDRKIQKHNFTGPILHFTVLLYVRHWTVRG